MLMPDWIWAWKNPSRVWKTVTNGTCITKYSIWRNYTMSKKWKWLVSHQNVGTSLVNLHPATKLGVNVLSILLLHIGIIIQYTLHVHMKITDGDNHILFHINGCILLRSQLLCLWYCVYWHTLMERVLIFMVGGIQLVRLRVLLVVNLIVGFDWVVYWWIVVVSFCFLS